MSELLKKHRDTGDIKDKPRSGHPKATDQADDNFIVQTANNEPFTNARKLLSSSMPIIMQ